MAVADAAGHVGGVEVFEEGLGVLAARAKEVAHLGDGHTAGGLELPARAGDHPVEDDRVEDNSLSRVNDLAAGDEVGKEGGVRGAVAGRGVPPSRRRARNRSASACCEGLSRAS